MECNLSSVEQGTRKYLATFSRSQRVNLVWPLFLLDIPYFRGNLIISHGKSVHLAQREIEMFAEGNPTACHEEIRAAVSRGR